MLFLSQKVDQQNLSDNRQWKQMLSLSIFICLLNQVGRHATVDGNVILPHLKITR